MFSKCREWNFAGFIVILLYLQDCESLFLRHSQSGKCITRSGELVYNNPNHAKLYYVVLTDNCLDVHATFRFLDTELLHNIELNGTFASHGSRTFKNRLFVYRGVSASGKLYQVRTEHRLKQTNAGSLYFYTKSKCGQPNVTSLYVDRKTFCDTPEQKVTFGSVTQYNTKMEDVNCSPIQRMVVRRADYGDFNNNGMFDGNTTIDTQCSSVTNCQVKSLCGGNRSCELTIDNNLLPSQYCPDTSKEIYTEYTCVDTYSSTTTAATDIRLHYSPIEGFIEIKDGSNWRKVNEENWDKIHQEMLCQHLGFNKTDANNISTEWIEKNQDIATGDLICYNTRPNGTSCCVHLVPSTTTSNLNIPYAKCKMCDKPALLQDETIFPDSVFSGSGSHSFSNARFNKNGWCSKEKATKFLLMDLQKEYHITRVVTMGDKDQTRWIGPYSMNYSHDNSFKNSKQMKGNQNGYQASITRLDIYNVRHIKIQSTGKTDFCLRIELCGEVQLPAPVDNIRITPSQYSAQVTWRIHGPTATSYITHIIIYLNGMKYQTISRGTQVVITGLKPYTDYTVGIQAEDGSSQNSTVEYRKFRTVGLSGPPFDVALKSHGKTSLAVSWKAPDKSSWNGELTGYQVCFHSMDTSPECLVLKSTKVLSLTLNNLRPSTKYFVTVSAITNVGHGEESLENSKITNGEPVNPLTTSYYTLSLNVPKPAEYIKEVMVIVQSAARSPIRSEDVKTSDLKPYKANTQDPYITAYLKTDVLPLTFVIGDGKEYNSEKEKYSNQPLTTNSSYVVFLRYFESKDSYYSTEWSSSVKTMVKPSVGFVNSQNSEQSTEDKTRMDLLIPLAILALCFLLSLGVIIYQRRRFKNKNKEESHKPQALEQVGRKGKFDSLPEPPNGNKSVNDDVLYEIPEIESIERNEAGSAPETSTEQEFSTYMSLKDNRGPENLYHSTQPSGTSADPQHTKGGDQTVQYQNPAFNAKF